MLPAVECHIGGILQALIVLIAEIGGDPAKYIENTLVAIQLKEFEHISGDPAKKILVAILLNIKEIGGKWYTN